MSNIACVLFRNFVTRKFLTTLQHYIPILLTSLANGNTADQLHKRGSFILLWSVRAVVFLRARFSLNEISTSV